MRKFLLAGYLSGDGCTANDGGSPLVVATTVSKALAFGIKALAASLGYTPTIAFRANQPDVIDGRKVNVRPAWNVRWRTSVDPAHAQTFREDGLEWAPIRERMDDVCTDADVFNIGVEEDESYVADGVIVHNCTFFSKARGAKPHRDKHRARRRRGLAGVVIKWAAQVRPRVICVENVEEFKEWGPLGEDGQPDPKRKGTSFRRWCKRLENLGYAIEYRELRACDYGAPTSRKRLFIVARCDGETITWPAPTHGPGRAQPYRTAAECIDWTIPCPSIFERKKPLAEATLRRIARGIQRYVIGSANPFIIPLTHQGGDRTYPIDEPLRTVTGANRGEQALIMPFLSTYHGDKRPGDVRGVNLDNVLPTQDTSNRYALVSAFLAKHYGGGPNGQQTPGSQMSLPIGTITAVDHHAVVACHLQRDFGASIGGALNEPHPTVTAGGGGHSALIASSLVKLKGTCKDGQPVTEPLGTVQAQGLHYAEVRAFLMTYYKTDLPTKDRFAIVTVHGIEYAIVDIGMRMLTPRELYRAQGFPSDYVIDPVINGKPMTKTAQVHKCGNSVPPPFSTALVRAQFAREAT